MQTSNSESDLIFANKQNINYETFRAEISMLIFNYVVNIAI